MRPTTPTGGVAGPAPEEHPDDSRAPELVAAVQAYAAGARPDHTLVSGGYGSGKSHALRRATELADVLGLSIARPPHGAFGVSSYADFLVTVAEARTAHSGGELSPGVERAFAADSIELLEDRALGPVGTRVVIVVEDVDQLVKQVRADDRPRLVGLLDRPGGPLLVGSVQGGQLPEEVRSRVRVVPTHRVSIDEGLRIATERARTLGVLTVDVGRALPPALHSVDDAVLDNPLFWTLVGDSLGSAGAASLARAATELRARAAPHFDAVLLRIAPSEQRVLLEIARAGAPRSVQELADSIGVRNQAAASALARLHADDWVRITEPPPGTDRRRTWYDIADPLLRLHLRSDDVGQPGRMIAAVRDAWSIRGSDEDVSVQRDLDDGSAEATERGESGEPEVARRWFEHLVTERIAQNGLSSPETLGAVTAWAVWTAESGARDRARGILDRVIDAADALAGPTSRDALEARSHAAWNLLEQGDAAEGERLYREVLDSAAAVGAREIAARARQDLGRALGLQGDTRAAVEEMTAAIAELEAIAAERRDGGDPDFASWEAVVRRARHGVHVWRGADGDVVAAIAGLRALAADADISAHDRHHVIVDALELEGASTDPAESARAFGELADEIADHDPVDLSLLRRVRRRSLEFAIAAAPHDPHRWPLAGVHPDDLVAVVLDRLDHDELGLDEVELVMDVAAASQNRALAVALVASRGGAEASPDERARRARVAAAHMPGTAERRLLSDLARALEGDPRGEASLSTEWRSMLEAMRATDVPQDRRRPPERREPLGQVRER